MAATNIVRRMILSKLVYRLNAIKSNTHILHISRRSHPEITIKSEKTPCNERNSEQREYHRDSHSRPQDVLTGSSSPNSPP